MLKFHIRTFGCQMNERDTEITTGILMGMGYTAEDDPEKADLVLLNSCSVRQKAERRVIGLLERLAHVRKTVNPSLRIVLMGCMPNLHGVDLSKDYPQIDLMLGTGDLERLPALLAKLNSTERRQSQLVVITDNRLVPPKESDPLETNSYNIYETTVRNDSEQAMVNVSTGCNKFCSYCVVPFARGKETSRRKEDIIAEVNAIDKTLYPQLLLLGQNVNTYGQDLYPDYNFADLLEEISQINGIKLIDFLTSHPADMSDRMIETIAANALITRTIHLPLQSGDNAILKLMNRGYTYEEYKALITRIKVTIPSAQITTDIIVGFPTETEEQFITSCRAIEEIGFTRVNTAAYSERPRTRAIDIQPAVSFAVRQERLQRMMTLIDILKTKSTTETHLSSLHIK